MYGQAVTFTATVAAVSPGAGTPTGTVQFKTNGVNFGSAVTLSGGSASSAPISSLAAGSYTVTADYSGDGSFNTSSATLAAGQTVNKANSSTAVSASVNPSAFGQPVTFSATAISGQLHLAFGTQPSRVTLGSTISPAVRVEVKGRPSLKVDREKVDFGDVKLDKTVTATFTLSNVGDQALRFTRQPFIEVAAGC